MLSRETKFHRAIEVFYLPLQKTKHFDDYTLGYLHGLRFSCVINENTKSIEYLLISDLIHLFLKAISLEGDGIGERE